MDFWEDLRILFNSSHIEGPVVPLEVLYLVTHGSASFPAVRSGTQF